MTANQEADRIFADVEEAVKRYDAADPADRWAYRAGMLEGHLRHLCREAEYTRNELKKVQQELLWERKNG